MASQSLYRKWRSQTFSDLVGQEAVVRTLLNAVRDGRLAHAYLFCGPRGTGKTSVARLLAKAVNCANPHNGEPCNECVSCQEITAGRSPDVIEIDAASNTGVDNIRDLRESVNLLGSGGHYRVFVVDEVHMLSTAAFNALLKTLEEPPPHVIFVLATTEAHKVLPTIVSRCQRFSFGRFSMRELVARLRHVAEGEGLELEPAVADLLARAAQGGMRDALSLLDQAMAFCGTRIDLERTRSMLGLADPGAIRRIIEHIAAEQSAEGLHLINEMVTNGADLRQLNAQLSEEWRALVLARAGADVVALMDRSEDEAREVAALARRFSLEELTACARVFARNETPARGLPVPQLALELSFLECLAIKRTGGASVASVTSVTSVAPTSTAPATMTTTAPIPPAREIAPEPRPAAAARAASIPAAPPIPQAPNANAPSAQRASVPEHVSPPPPEVEVLDLRAIANGTAAPLSVSAPAVASADLSDGDQDAELDELPLPAEPEDDAPEDEYFADDDTPAPYASDTYADWLGQVQSQWTVIKQVCKQKSMKVAALLHSARPVQVEPGEVPVLVLLADYQFHLEKLRETESRTAIEWALEQVLSAPLRVRMTLTHGGSGNGPATPNGNGSGGPRGGSGPSSPRNPGTPGASGGPNGMRDSGNSSYSGKNGNRQGNGQSRPVARADTPQPNSSALAPIPADTLATGHDNQSVNSGKNGNRSGAVRDATSAYLPANVTPLRPAAARAAARLEDAARADAVIQTLLNSGIELADVQPLADDDEQA